VRALRNSSFQFVIVCLLASFLAQAQTSVPQSESPQSSLARRAAEMGTGKWWITLSEEERDKFVERYAKGMNHAGSVLVADCAEVLKGLPGNHAAEVDIASSWALCKVAASFDFDFDRKELREGVDAFYKDSTNLSAPIEVALARVRDALAAKHPRGQAVIGGVRP
jgi:hypothetical protein